MISTFSLKMDKSTLESQARKLRESDGDGRDIERAVDNLVNVVLNDIQSDNVGQLLDKLDQMRERPLASGNDSNINQAYNMIQNEIRTIEAAIEAQRKAAEILKSNK